MGNYLKNVSVLSTINKCVNEKQGIEEEKYGNTSKTRSV